MLVGLFCCAECCLYRNHQGYVWVRHAIFYDRALEINVAKVQVSQLHFLPANNLHLICLEKDNVEAKVPSAWVNVWIARCLCRSSAGNHRRIKDHLRPIRSRPSDRL